MYAVSGVSCNLFSACYLVSDAARVSSVGIREQSSRSINPQHLYHSWIAAATLTTCLPLLPCCMRTIGFSSQIPRRLPWVSVASHPVRFPPGVSNSRPHRVRFHRCTPSIFPLHYLLRLHFDIPPRNIPNMLLLSHEMATRGLSPTKDELNSTGGHSFCWGLFATFR